MEEEPVAMLASFIKENEKEFRPIDYVSATKEKTYTEATKVFKQGNYSILTKTFSSLF